MKTRIPSASETGLVSIYVNEMCSRVAYNKITCHRYAKKLNILTYHDARNRGFANDLSGDRVARQVSSKSNQSFKVQIFFRIEVKRVVMLKKHMRILLLRIIIASQRSQFLLNVEDSEDHGQSSMHQI